MTGGSPANDDVPVIEILEPDEQTLPVVVASPHSGRRYTPEFLALSRLDPHALRRSEDGFMDQLCRHAPILGAPLIHALFPRAWVDPNREPYELDPDMFADPLPAYVNTRSPRVAVGLGTIARVVAAGEPIYARKLDFAAAAERIEQCWRPYHAALRRLIDHTRERFGYCLLLDCHSMPSRAPHPERLAARKRAQKPAELDIVLGDSFGAACAAALTGAAADWWTRAGYAVARNSPYAGGYTTRHYGAPARGVHALQIEINRALYMDEITLEPKAGFDRLQQQIGQLIETLGQMDPALFHPTTGAPVAAE